MLQPKDRIPARRRCATTRARRPRPQPEPARAARVPAAGGRSLPLVALGLPRVLGRLCAALAGATLVFGCAAGAPALSQQVPASRAEITLSFAPVVRAAAPGVVNIYTRKEVPAAALNPFAADPFFRYFFEGLGRPAPRQQPENSLGSGVILRPDGLIVTNYHVIEAAEEIMVVTSDRREFQARVIGADEA